MSDHDLAGLGKTAPSERTIKSIRLQGDPLRTPHYLLFDCGCMDRHVKGWILCQYHEGFDDAARQADELQALIDDVARTWADHVRTGSFGHARPFHALMAAATKDDDPTA